MVSTTATPGTVKIGRWTYPALREGRVVHRNTKRDGSGEWVNVSLSAFEPEAPSTNGATKSTSTHGGKPGAQTNKPGKSTWQVGDKCPQGHVLEEGDVYTIPSSGRHKCMKCRAGYNSNVARKGHAK